MNVADCSLYSTFQISFSAVLPLTLLAWGLLDALGLSKSSPSLSVSDNWASSSLELWELLHFSSDAGFSSLLLSSARQLLVLRRVLDRRITWSFSHSFLNRWTGPEIKKVIVDTLFSEAYHLQVIRFCSLHKNIDPLQKWRLYLNNNSYTTLASHTLEKSFVLKNEYEAKNVLSIVVQI